MDRADFPWRSLGRILVEDELLTSQDLERALAQQRETGRLLGEILIEQGSMTGASLAQALARQHGVELEQGDLDHEPVFAPTKPRRSGAPSAQSWSRAGSSRRSTCRRPSQ